MNPFPALCASLALWLAAPLSAADWTLREEGSSLRFAGESQGERFDGRFADFAAAIRFEPDQPGAARFDVDIALASADSQNEERDEALLGSDFFDVERFPRARFVATQVVAVDEGFEARGTLTLRDASRPVVLSFTWTALDDGARLEGRARLDRTAFGVGGGDWADAEMIAHTVDVSTTLVLDPAR